MERAHERKEKLHQYLQKVQDPIITDNILATDLNLHVLIITTLKEFVHFGRGPLLSFAPIKRTTQKQKNACYSSVFLTDFTQNSESPLKPKGKLVFRKVVPKGLELGAVEKAHQHMWDPSEER